jgi:proteic killer suppression protein
VLKTFKNKELLGLWSTGRSKIDGRMHKRILIRLGALNEASTIDDVKLPGYDFHALHGFKPVRYTIHINGPWCITFEFEGGNAYRIDFEQYH